MTLLSQIRGASAVGAVLLGTTGNAHADTMHFVNDSDAWVAFVLAEPDGSCPSGMRDHWVTLNTRETKDVQVNTSGRVLLAAGQVIPAGSGFIAGVPLSNRDLDNWWSPPVEHAGEGGCSDIRPNDSGLNPNAGIWHGIWNLSRGCPGSGTLGAFARPMEGDQDGVMEYNLVCFVDGPAEPPLPREPGVPPQ